MSIHYWEKNAVAACHELLAGSLKKSYFVFQFLCVFIEFFFNLKGHCSRSRWISHYRQIAVCIVGLFLAASWEQHRRALLGPSLEIWRRHSTSSALCWHSHADGTVHQTFNTWRPCLPSGFSICMEQPAIICQECTVADDVTSQTEGCTFSVVVRRWLAGRDCIAQYNCCLPAATDCRNFCIIWFNFVRCPCNVFDMTVSP